MSEMRPVKVKRAGNDKVTVLYEVSRTDSDVWDQYSVSSLDRPSGSFVKAFDKLLADALEILEMPEKYGENMRVTGVSYSYGGDEDVMGAVLTCQKRLSTANTPLIVNTPHLPSEDYSKNGDQPTLPSEMIVRLQTLGREAIDYANGKRAQMELALDQEQDKKEEAQVDDQLKADAIKIIAETKRATTSSIQRRLKIGYTRAARIMDLLEADGIIGPPRGSDPREILVDLTKGAA